MRVAFLVDPGDPHGLAAVAERLGVHGVGATVVVPGGVAPPALDLAVATGARTVAGLDAVPAARRALFLMDMDDRALPAGSTEAEAAAAIYPLPLPKIVPARWMADQLAQLGPAPVQIVPPGIDHQHFAPPADVARDDAPPLRVLVLGAPGVPAAGLDEAVAAAAAMREPATVAQLDPDAAPPAERAAAYAGADVVLALPRIAGFPRAPLEAFHRGATCVMTAVTGQDEYVVDGVNGLLTSWDDERGTSRLLDLLARDRALLHRLRSAALDTARAWPDADEGARLLAAALEAVA
jgi:glycosyltransferase involved in cell wall biosynthesis